jgi:hypothetical protein
MPQIRQSWPVASQQRSERYPGAARGPTRWARIWFAVTALCVLAGVALSVYTAVQTPGHFPGGAERGFNTFAFFTVQSNLIAGGTSLLLAIRLDRPSVVFRTFRLIGLVAIQLVHTVVPVLTVVGWLVFGPRGATSRRVAWLSLIFPACWLAFTLIRGAVIGWYPYPFIDVSVIGYGKAILNAFWVSLLLLGLAAGATALDSRLGPRQPPQAS